jgi:hypothetical protein
LRNEKKAAQLQLETRTLTWPFYFSIFHLGGSAPSLFLTLRQSAIVIKLYALLYFYQKIRVEMNLMKWEDLLKSKLLTDSALIIGILGFAMLPQWCICWAQRFLCDDATPPQKNEES